MDLIKDDDFHLTEVRVYRTRIEHPILQGFGRREYHLDALL
jgi:hypothetical protein